MVEFDANDALQAYGAGLRPSQGHAADTAYIFHYYGHSAIARGARLTMGGQTYSYARSPADATRRGPKTGYTAGSYTPVVRLGEFACHAEAGALRCDQGRTFAPVAPGVLRNAPFGVAGLNTVELRLVGDRVSTYAHTFGPHAFRFDFDPPIPPAASLRGGETFAYTVSLDDAAQVVRGRIRVARDGDGVALNWTPEAPAWMAARPMTTRVSPRADGYTLSLLAAQ